MVHVTGAVSDVSHTRSVSSRGRSRSQIGTCDAVLRGCVKNWFGEYGFVRPHSGGQDLYVSVHAIANPKPDDTKLVRGQEVELRLNGKDRKGRPRVSSCVLVYHVGQDVGIGSRQQAQCRSGWTKHVKLVDEIEMHIVNLNGPLCTVTMGRDSKIGDLKTVIRTQTQIPLLEQCLIATSSNEKLLKPIRMEHDVCQQQLRFIKLLFDGRFRLQAGPQEQLEQQLCEHGLPPLVAGDGLKPNHDHILLMPLIACTKDKVDELVARIADLCSSMAEIEARPHELSDRDTLVDVFGSDVASGELTLVRQKRPAIQPKPSVGCACACFDGQANMLLSDGSVKAANEIVPGDVLATPHGIARVQARTIQAAGVSKDAVIVEDRLLITPSHRIYVDGRWIKPIQAKTAKQVCTDVALYNFITEPVGESVVVEDLTVSTLGAFCEGSHLQHKPSHKLWNSSKIVSLMQRHPSWPNVRFCSDDPVVSSLKKTSLAEHYLSLFHGDLLRAPFRNMTLSSIIQLVDPVEFPGTP